jgi:hypothetical protein
MSSFATRMVGFLLVVMLGVPHGVRAQVIINELLASNASGLRDEDGDRSDWIELRNAGTQSVNLSGWSLSDDPGRPRQWLFPDMTLAPGSYLLVFASGKDRKPTDGGNLHTNFVLSRGGEYLALYDDKGLARPGAAFDPEYPAQRSDRSFGTHPSESGHHYLASPSPGEPNRPSSYLGVAVQPEANPGRGFYAEAVTVSLTSADLGAAIFYTLDGREPTRETGRRYQGPLTLSQSGVLRARSFRADLEPSATTTHTYLIAENRAVRSLPVLAITGDPREALYEPNGIMAIQGGHYGENQIWVPASPDDYNNTLKRGRAWERPISLEYFRADGAGQFQVDAGLRVGGSDAHRSRYRRTDGDWLDCTFPQGKHSKFTLKTYFRRAYGPAKLRFPLIPDAPVDVFDALSLRAGYADWCNPFLKDELIRRLHHDMGSLVALGTMVNLFSPSDTGNSRYPEPGTTGPGFA